MPDLWIKDIDHVAEILIVEGIPGHNIYDSMVAMCDIANHIDYCVAAELNGVCVIANSGDDPSDVIEQWLNETHHKFRKKS